MGAARQPRQEVPKGAAHLRAEELPRAARLRGVAQQVTARRRGRGSPATYPHPGRASSFLVQYSRRDRVAGPGHAGGDDHDRHEEERWYVDRAAGLRGGALCAGPARLTAAFIEQGLPALAIDCRASRHQPEAPWLVVDIGTSEGAEQLAQLLDQDDALELVWFGLPCGTASRAREIQDRPGLPQPLRTVAEPWGRTDVKFNGQEETRVMAASAVYRTALRFIESCTARGVRWIIENRSTACCGTSWST